MKLTLHDVFKTMNWFERIEVILDPPCERVLSINTIYSGEMGDYNGENYPIFVMFNGGERLVFVVTDLERTN